MEQWGVSPNQPFFGMLSAICQASAVRSETEIANSEQRHIWPDTVQWPDMTGRVCATAEVGRFVAATLQRHFLTEKTQT